MRRLAAATLAICLCLGLVACAGNTPASSSAPGPSQSSETSPSQQEISPDVIKEPESHEELVKLAQA